MRNLDYRFAESECNTWFFAWFAGDMLRVWDAETEWLDFIAYERQRDNAFELHLVKTNVMRRLTHGLSSTITSH